MLGSSKRGVLSLKDPPVGAWELFRRRSDMIHIPTIEVVRDPSTSWEVFRRRSERPLTEEHMTSVMTGTSSVTDLLDSSTKVVGASALGALGAALALRAHEEESGILMRAMNRLERILVVFKSKDIDWGFPHTLGSDCVVFPTGEVPSFGTFVHEIVHVLQRVSERELIPVYADRGWVRSERPPSGSRPAHNPDGVDNGMWSREGLTPVLEVCTDTGRPVVLVYPSNGSRPTKAEGEDSRRYHPNEESARMFEEFVSECCREKNVRS